MYIIVHHVRGVGLGLQKYLLARCNTQVQFVNPIPPREGYFYYHASIIRDKA